MKLNPPNCIRVKWPLSVLAVGLISAFAPIEALSTTRCSQGAFGFVSSEPGQSQLAHDQDRFESMWSKAISSETPGNPAWLARLGFTATGSVSPSAKSAIPQAAQEFWQPMSGPSSLFIFLNPELGFGSGHRSLLSPPQIEVLLKMRSSWTAEALWGHSYSDSEKGRFRASMRSHYTVYPLLHQLGIDSRALHPLRELKLVLSVHPSLKNLYPALREQLFEGVLAPLLESRVFPQNWDTAIGAAALEALVLAAEELPAAPGHSPWLAQPRPFMIATLSRIYDLYLGALADLEKHHSQHFVFYMRSRGYGNPGQALRFEAQHHLHNLQWLKTYGIQPGSPNEIAVNFNTYRNAVKLIRAYTDRLQPENSVLSQDECLKLARLLAIANQDPDMFIQHTPRVGQIPLSLRAAIFAKIEKMESNNLTEHPRDDLTLAELRRWIGF